jgi:DNA-binding transcriptional LysR family regulator
MLLPKLDPYHLLVFYFVANAKSISSAAKELFLTQPTVTGHIKALEDSVNIKLIEIRSQRVNLTPAGEGLFQYTKELYQDLLDADRFIELMKESSLNIGISLLFTNLIAPVIKTMFDDLYPSAKLTIKSDEAFVLVQDVLAAKLDLAIVPRLDYGNPKLSNIGIIDEVKLAFYTSSTNPIFQKERIEWQDIYSYPLIMGTETSAVRKIALTKLKAEGLTMTPRLGPGIVSNTALIRKVVQSGNYVSLALAKDIEDELHARKLRIIPAPSEIWIGADAVLHRNTFISPMIKKFLSLTREAFQSAK